MVPRGSGIANGLNLNYENDEINELPDMAQNRSKKTTAISTNLIAPCGMNCLLCSAYTRDKKHVPVAEVTTASNRNPASCVESRTVRRWWTPRSSTALVATASLAKG